MKVNKLITTIGLGLLLAAPMSASAANYSMASFTDLGAGKALAVNNSGVVAASNDSFAYTWSNGTFNNFGFQWTESSKAIAINDNGTVLGKDTGTGKNFTYHNDTDIIIYSNVEMRATAINNTGNIVGYNNNTGEAIMIKNGVKQVLAGIDRAYGINDSDQVVGYNWDGPVAPNNWQRAVVYDHGNVTVLGALGDNPDMSFGDVINNNGNVSGISWTQDWGSMTSFFWEAGTDPNNLQEVPNVAGNTDGSTYIYGMNDQDMLVGKTRKDRDEWEGILFDGEDLVNLNDLAGFDDMNGWFINDVKDINNDNGNGTYTLVGTLKKIGAGEHAFVMEINTVPVPGTVLLLATGLIGLIGIRRKQN